VQSIHIVDFLHPTKLVKVLLTLLLDGLGIGNSTLRLGLGVHHPNGIVGGMDGVLSGGRTFTDLIARTRITHHGLSHLSSFGVDDRGIVAHVRTAFALQVAR